jgi:hypothetical protein
LVRQKEGNYSVLYKSRCLVLAEWRKLVCSLQEPLIGAGRVKKISLFSTRAVVWCWQREGNYFVHYKSRCLVLAE